MNKEMKNKLSALIGSDNLVSIYNDTEEPDTFELGYLLQIDDNNILINTVDKYGVENGFCIINLNDIFIFDVDKMYSEKIQELFNIKNQKRKYIKDLGINTMNNFLKYAVDNNLLIEINEDDNYMGYISYFSSEILVLQIVDNYCNDLGPATIDMDNVNTLKCQSRYLRDLELLCNKKWKD